MPEGGDTAAVHAISRGRAEVAAMQLALHVEVLRPREGAMRLSCLAVSSRSLH